MSINNKSTENTTQQTGYLRYKWNAQDRNHLQDLCNIFTPFEVATHSTQGQNCVVLSYFVPCVIGLKAALNNMHSRYKMVWQQL